MVDSRNRIDLDDEMVGLIVSLICLKIFVDLTENNVIVFTVHDHFAFTLTAKKQKKTLQIFRHQEI